MGAFRSPRLRMCLITSHLPSSGLMTRFPLVTAITASVIFFTVSLIMLAVFILPTIQSGLARDEVPTIDEKKDESAPVAKTARRRSALLDSETEDSERDQPPRRKPSREYLRRRRSVSGSSGLLDNHLKSTTTAGYKVGG